MKRAQKKNVYDAKKSQQELIEQIRVSVAALSANSATPCGVLDDMSYFLDHYDVVTGLSHQRCEAWGLGWAVLSSLEFNLPIMMKKVEVVPERLVRQAGKELGLAAGAGQTGQGRRKLMARARRLWAGELKDLYEAVAAYRYYAEAGVVDRGGKARRKAARGLARWETLDKSQLVRLRDQYWREWTGLYQKMGQDLWG